MCKDCGGASICAHRRVRSTCKDCMRRKACLPPPARSCDRCACTSADDTSRTSAQGLHRRSSLRPCSTHSPSVRLAAGLASIHRVSVRAHNRVHYSAHGHMQRPRWLALWRLLERFVTRLEYGCNGVVNFVSSDFRSLFAHLLFRLDSESEMLQASPFPHSHQFERRCE
jgi:hypothetical protein